ncbi:MAG TPA: sodium-translocating pyrophosphatase [Armatimonadota bacterium]|nr:sodium-translocating pyrophosphatase [Armatimonadota bacterium]
MFALSALGMLLSTAPARAGEANLVLPPLGAQEYTILHIVFASAIVSLLFGYWLVRKVMAVDEGTQAMKDVAAAIHDGAMAYLARQIKTMIWLVIGLAILLFFVYKGVFVHAAEVARAADPTYQEIMSPTALAVGLAFAFILGVAASYGAGFVGMKMAVRGNVRVAAQALRSYKGALETAFRAGSVAGMFTVGLGLLGATIVFYIFRQEAMKVLLGFGFGGALAALFMRVGGGIFTKAADVGADLVGKVEQGIPEDDPRNAATIADNVGDNVGDCAGMAADVFESYEVTLVAAIILGAAAGPVGSPLAPFVMKLIMYPLLVRAVGVVASIIGILSVRGKDDENMDPMAPISRGYWIAAGVAVIGFGVITRFFMNDFVADDGTVIAPWYSFFCATLMGIILALVIERLTEYFTATEKAPVTEIANSTKTGPATVILSGLSVGLESSVWSVVAIGATIIGSVLIFPGSPALAAYGIALSGLGLLTTTGYMLAMDTYGPISDNANGIFEMSGALEGNEGASRIVAKLDAVGNTTKALTKGLAIATAVIAATALFRSFMADAGLLPPEGMAALSAGAEDLLRSGIHLDWPEVFVGMLIGGAVPFLFSSFAINAVSRAAFMLVQEVRRQFREIPGIMEGKNKPDYQRCVDISTAAAQKELLGPGILAVFAPILVGFGLGFADPLKGAASLGGFLAGAILSGQLMAVFMSNTGGAWDNAKKKVEDGFLGGKGTDAHKAAVIGDTVGDPLKDTAGPALNPMIKVMNLVAVLIAPIVIQDISLAARTLVVLMAIAFLAVAVLFSKKGGITTKEAEEVPAKTRVGKA